MKAAGIGAIPWPPQIAANQCHAIQKINIKSGHRLHSRGANQTMSSSSPSTVPAWVSAWVSWVSGAANAWVSGAAGAVIVEASGASGAVVVGVTGDVAVEVVEVVEAGIGESPAGVGVADAGVEGAAAW